MWSHVRYLVALEYKRLRFAYLFCFWFTLFYGWLISQIAVIVHDPATDSSRFSIAWNSVTLDCFFLLVVPTISFLLQRKMFGLYWKTDMYSQNLQYMKRFPIDAKVIVYSRFIRHAINTVVLLALFFTAFALGFNAMVEQNLSASTAVAFALIWLGYALASGGLYAYWENMMSGMRYFQLTLLIMVLTPILFILIHIGTGFTLVGFTLDLAESPFKFAWSTLLLGIGSVMTIIIGKVLANRLQKRDFC